MSEERSGPAPSSVPPPPGPRRSIRPPSRAPVPAPEPAPPADPDDPLAALAGSAKPPASPNTHTGEPRRGPRRVAPARAPSPGKPLAIAGGILAGVILIVFIVVMVYRSGLGQVAGYGDRTEYHEVDLTVQNHPVRVTNLTVTNNESFPLTVEHVIINARYVQDIDQTLGPAQTLEVPMKGFVDPQGAAWRPQRGVGFFHVATNRGRYAEPNRGSGAGGLFE